MVVGCWLVSLALFLPQKTGPQKSAPENTAPRVVLIAGEDEYDSETSLSALANLLHDRHGMTTTLATSHSAETVGGLDSLADADLAVVFVRFRTWPEGERRKLEAFLARGGALVALRTTTHAFAYPEGSPFVGENDGFGTRWIGTPWRWHHGHSSSTDVTIVGDGASDPTRDQLSRGVEASFHVRSWLYHVLPLPDDAHVVARGTAVKSERADAGALDAEPVAWTRVRADGGRTFYTSMGHPEDFEVAAFRRLLLNGIEWSLRREIPDKLDTTLPATPPLTDFEVSTAYVSDWSRPIAQQVFPPEEGIAGFNDVNWIPIKSADGTLDLRRFDPNSKQGTIYVKSKLVVKGARELELVLQSDDGLEVFIDGKRCFSRQEVRTLLCGCERVTVSLSDGEHELLLKVMNAGDAWGVRARVRDLTNYREGK